MATQAQIDANRRNAQHSTGPRTDGGKNVTRKNALRHGLRAAEAVVPGESEWTYRAFARAMLAELRPVGVLQRLAADRIVHLQWKLQRIPRLERQAVDELIQTFARPGDDATVVMQSDLAPGSKYNQRSRLIPLQSYEMRIDRAIHALQRELRELRKEAEARGDESLEGMEAEGFEGLAESEGEVAGAAIAGDVMRADEGIAGETVWAGEAIDLAPPGEGARPAERAIADRTTAAGERIESAPAGEGSATTGEPLAPDAATADFALTPPAEMTETVAIVDADEADDAPGISESSVAEPIDPQDASSDRAGDANAIRPNEPNSAVTSVAADRCWTLSGAYRRAG